MIGVLIVAVVLAAVLVALAGEAAEEVVEGIRAAALLLVAAVGLAVAVGGLGRLLLVGLGILDLVVGLVDLVHLLGGGGVAGIEVRVLLFRQTPVCTFDLFFRSAVGHAQNLIRVLRHTLASASRK